MMEKINIKMKNGYVLVKEILEETVTEAGIIMPQPKYDRKALVYAALPDDGLYAGDIVIRALGKGTAMTINDQEFEVIHNTSIMAVLK